MKFVIKGAYYKSEDEILIPHFTGEYSMVDCDRFITKEELEGMYDEKFIQENEDIKIEVEGVLYYYAEYSPDRKSVV